MNIASCNLCAMAKVKGHIELKIEENTSLGKSVELFQIGSCTSFTFMGYDRQKWHSFGQQLAAIFNVPFRPNRLLKEKKNRDARSKTKRTPLLWGYVKIPNFVSSHLVCFERFVWPA